MRTCVSEPINRGLNSPTSLAVRSSVISKECGEEADLRRQNEEQCRRNVRTSGRGEGGEGSRNEVVPVGAKRMN